MSRRIPIAANPAVGDSVSLAEFSASDFVGIENGGTGAIDASGARSNLSVYSIDQSNTQNSAMTKAQFNSLAEERKASGAGSGFDEWGKYYLASEVAKINDGMFVYSTLPNSIHIGRSSGSGSSKTDSPVLTVNGVRVNMSYVNSSSQNYISFLTSPSVYPHETALTTEQIASGVIKHADSSNSGLVVNGKGLTGPTFTQTITVVNGKEYIIEYKDNGVRKTLDITATSTSYIISLTGTNITEVGMYPLDAISRTDLVLLESWHEDIAEKGFVYSFGNTQYLGSNTNGLTGIANGAFTGFETYSLFGNWQTPSSLIGKGYAWSSLTEAQKKAFISNPDNNCYLDGDKVIQVRYRVRVVQGRGDHWINTNVRGTPLFPHYGILCYSNYLVDSVIVKGKNASILNEYGSYSTNPCFLSNFETSVINTDIGSWGATGASNPNGYTGAYDSKCFAIPIALVHRRNQGMYHYVYNPNGTKAASDSLDCFRTAGSFTSISDCFNPAKLLTASGYIGTVSGRPDGLFYDQVHEGDILDLRNSSKKPENYNRLISREFNKLVAGTTRGFEGEKYTEITTQTTTGTVATVQVKNGTRYKRGDVIYIYDLTASSVKGRFVVVSISINTLTVDTAFAKLANSYMISGASSTRTKSNTLLVCDVIGNTSNYPSVWKNNEVTFTTLHTAEDGTSLLPNGVLDSFKLSRDANGTPLLCLRSIDNGATWTSFTPIFSTTTNVITLTDEPAGNLVLVYYQTKTSMAIPTVNSEVLELGEVLGTNGLANGALVSTLIGKAPTANTAPYSQIGYSVSGYRIDMSTFKFSTTSAELPVHSALSLAGGAIGVPAVKVLPYLTRLNGKAFLNLVFKEMKHNGTSWGDSSKFEIVDNVSTATDFNAQTVLIGQKTVELPYFIGADE